MFLAHATPAVGAPCRRPVRILALLKILMLILLAVRSVHPVSATPDQIQVRLFESHPGLNTIQIGGPFRVIRPVNEAIIAGIFTLTVHSTTVVLNSTHRQIENALIVLGPLNGKPIAVTAAGKLRHYAGELTFTAEASRGAHNPSLRALNTLPTLNYVQSVVGSETEPGWPRETLKAQAVLAQTIVARLRPGEIIGDSTQRELYLGTDYVRPGIAESVKSVWHEILTYNRLPAIVFYGSTCAGMTSNGADVFGDSAKGLSYLKATRCDFCKQSPFWKETVTHIDAERFAHVFGSKLPTVDASDKAGRPTAITYELSGQKQHLSGYQFWMLLGQKFGWDKAPGLKFSLSREGKEIVVRSTGAGHGVGLCNWGAAEQARLGRTYKQILEYYFPGCVVAKQAH
ncbi:MAG TPA: SpoIID/LytB domain-containing protein [Planktothrix sp.]